MATPQMTWLVRVGIVVVVVAGALLVRGAGDDDAAAPIEGGSTTATPTPTPTPTAPPTVPPTKVDPDTFCAAFIAFADAQAQYVAAPDDPATQQGLVDASDALLALGQPLGLSDGGLISLRELVDSSLAQEGDPTDVPTQGRSDDAAFADYLATTCPA